MRHPIAGISVEGIGIAKKESQSHRGFDRKINVLGNGTCGGDGFHHIKRSNDNAYDVSVPVKKRTAAVPRLNGSRDLSRTNARGREPKFEVAKL